MENATGEKADLRRETGALYAGVHPTEGGLSKRRDDHGR